MPQPSSQRIRRVSLEPRRMYEGAASSQSSASTGERDWQSELPRYPIGL